MVRWWWWTIGERERDGRSRVALGVDAVSLWTYSTHAHTNHILTTWPLIACWCPHEYALKYTRTRGTKDRTTERAWIQLLGTPSVLLYNSRYFRGGRHRSDHE